MTLALAVGAVFVLAALTPLLVRLLDRNAGYLGGAVLLAVAGWIGVQAPAVLDDEHVTQSLAWLPDAGIDFALRLDGLALLFSMIVLVVGAMVLAYAARYFGPDSPKTARYLSLLTLFAGAMLGLVLADDVLLLFVFWELTSVSSFFLIGGLGEGKQGATRAFLTTGLGGLALLAGVTLLAVAAGTGSLHEILASRETILASGVASAAIVLLLLAAFTKSAQFPFHFWLPGAMVAPTPVSTYLHAATMVKAGIYLLFRFTPLFGGVPLWQVTLVLVGMGTALFGAVVATKQNDLKALLAYSTISQLGLMVGIIGIGTFYALAAASLHVLAHALYKAALFMTVGIVDHEAGTRDLRRLGGLRRTLPLTALAGGLAAASMAGIPPLLGFVSKEEIFAAFLEANDPAWLGVVGIVLAVLASIGTVAYSARYYLGTFEGPERTHAHRAPRSFAAPAALLGLLGLGLSAVVGRFDPLVDAVGVVTTGNHESHMHLALWHGFGLPLLLSSIVLGLGLGAVLLRTRIETWQQRITLPRGADVFDRIYDGVLALGTRVGSPSVPHGAAFYLMPVVLTLATVGVASTLRVGTDGLGDPAPWLAADWAIVVLLAAAIVGTVQARSRLAAIATLGMAGFTVAGWFILLGAPDLALTQILVETLSVALFVVVFRRLPSTFPKVSQVRKVTAAVVAVVVGTLVGVGTYLFTGRRELSEVGAQFLADGEGLTGGANVVNTILVDFRALDTLGEITVLAVAGAAIFSLVRLSSRSAVPRPGVDGEPLTPTQWGGIGVIDSPILRTCASLLAPAMVLASLWLLLRGHDAVGGGFIGGLAVGAAVVLLYLARGHQRIWQSRLLRTLPLVGVGLLVAVGYGVGGLVSTGAFLDGAKWYLPFLPFHLEVAASLVFDIGVYLVVVGLVVAIVRHLGQGIPEPPPDPNRIGIPTWASDAGETRPRDRQVLPPARPGHSADAPASPAEDHSYSTAGPSGRQEHQ
ncbi:hydrogen gas-evolving membrane-bound hydrogenase subunit E [Egicoccus halophilus]|uniref:Monovalent cation/H+ antiporter subunit A n=1 Tax=Egicoccus halophilus TaxID=1670830 RepID=A0A8J3ETA6_9ACTN|nr:hydrogen gas-evolving membrane-bound hydrogenase subunit E [Egicoccus halophilus]GGI05234.1 monovalent cation/H+ antiporter subunit A [Egicoccus halophilus]